MSTLSITFRTLKGSTFKLDAAPADTVVDLKRKVAEHQNLHVDNPASYRLIYKGKILNDEATVASSSITDQGFVVVMPPKKQIPKPSKPAAAPASAATASTPAPASSTPSAPAPNTPAAAPASTAPSTTAAADTTTTAAAAAASAPASTDALSAPGESLVMGAAYEASVKRIMEMGFPEDQVKRAMRAAYNNPDRAVDYIFNGIPDMPDAPPGAPPGAAPASTAPSTAAATAPSSTAPSSTPADATTAPAQNRTTAPPREVPGTPFNMFEPAPPANSQRASGGTADPAGAPTGSDLDVLRNNPQFMMMRRLIQANPAVLPQILQQLESVNPALMALIEANHEEFSRMLNEPLPEGDGVNDEVVDQLSQMMANAGGPGGPGDPGGASGNQIYVTEEENQQILRLTELGATIGLERAHVLETWLACNRDETLAANFLVDHAEELRADQAEEAANAPDRRNQPDDEQGPGGPPA